MRRTHVIRVVEGVVFAEMICFQAKRDSSNQIIYGLLDGGMISGFTLFHSFVSLVRDL